MTWEYLRENWLREPFQDIAEGDDAWQEGLELQWELMNPFDFHFFDFMRTPNIDEFIKMMYKPTVSYLGLRAALWFTGEQYLGFWARQAWIWETRRAAAQAALPTLGKGAALVAPVVVATAGAIGYEKMVNEPLREAHGGWDIDWFGPFASGFGTAV